MAPEVVLVVALYSYVRYEVLQLRERQLYSRWNDLRHHALHLRSSSTGAHQVSGHTGHLRTGDLMGMP